MSTDNPKGALTLEILLTALLLVLGFATYWVAKPIPDNAFEPLGAGFVPRAISFCLIGLAALNIWRCGLLEFRRTAGRHRCDAEFAPCRYGRGPCPDLPLCLDRFRESDSLYAEHGVLRDRRDGDPFSQSPPCACLCDRRTCAGLCHSACLIHRVLRRYLRRRIGRAAWKVFWRR